LRAITAGLTIFAIYIIWSGRKTTFVRKALVPWLVFMAILMITISLTRPPNHFAGLLQSMGAVLTVILILPFQIPTTTLIMAAFSTVQISAVVLRLDPASHPEIMDDLIALIMGFAFANFLGFILALRNASLRRMNFAARLQDRRIQRQLLAEIQHREAVQADLVEARHAADEASRAKSDFLSSMSHELRTPLNAITNYTLLVREELMGIVPDQTIDDMNKIEAAGSHLLSLINQVLDLSKIEARKIDLELKEIYLPDFLQGLNDLLLALAETSGNELVIAQPDAAPTIIADEKLLRQVVINIVSNAFKFTKDGTVTVTIDHDLDHRDPAILVRDTGIGMDPVQLARVFGPFEQAAPSIRHNFGGTGLGLTISRQLTHLMGGTIEAQSELGKGSVFRVRLPMAKMAKAS
jgi:signal transduction histidine kinase